MHHKRRLIRIRVPETLKVSLSSGAGERRSLRKPVRGAEGFEVGEGIIAADGEDREGRLHQKTATTRNKNRKMYGKASMIEKRKDCGLLVDEGQQKIPISRN